MSLASSRGRHSGEESSWWQRRSRKGKVGILTASFMFVGLVAWAIFQLIGGVNGSVTGASYAINLDAVSAPSNPACLVSANLGTGDIDVTWDGALADDICEIKGWYTAPSTNSGDLQLQDFIVPAGLDISLDGIGFGCGKVAPPDDTSNLFVATLTYNGSQTNVTFNPVTDGFVFVRDIEYNAGLCPAVTP